MLRGDSQNDWHVSDYFDRLKSRHIQFIALGGTIGTGLFLGIGLSLTRAGPLSILLGYSLTGMAVFAMVRLHGPSPECGLLRLTDAISW